MHGGAPGSGAPRANQNARQHGLFTKDAIAGRRRIQALLGEARKLLQEAGAEHHRPLITVFILVRVLPGSPIFACSASYGTAGHPVSRALDIADRAYVLDQGGVVCQCAAHELLADNDIKERYCSV